MAFRFCRYVFMAIVSNMVLAGCSGSNGPEPQSNVDGQVRPIVNPSVSYYQAARFLEQASWGPSATSIAEVQRLGLDGWIDKQLTATPTQMTNVPSYVIDYDNVNNADNNRANGWFEFRFFDAAFSGADQLRQRLSWALFNFIPIKGDGQTYARVEYYNMLQRNSLASFKDVLREVTLHPAMGQFLNNDQNEGVSPNENYARELMQLFSVGLVKLNPDGSTARDAAGFPIQTYTQEDVKQATRALSGWRTVWEQGLPKTNGGNFGKRMVAKSWSGAHDTSAKRILGKDIPAGQSASTDLESMLDILVTHSNAGPFVSRRLIQHLVSSDPSPEYLARVSTVFSQSSGDLKKVVRAILLDPEARAGDNPAIMNPRAGRIKEPLLGFTNAMVAMGCRLAVVDVNNPLQPKRGGRQQPFAAPSVFGDVSPNHKTPGTLKPAPEEALLTGDEFVNRANALLYKDGQAPINFRNAGCDLDSIESAANLSDDALITWIADRHFRGVMPQPLRLSMQTLLRDRWVSQQSAWGRYIEMHNLMRASPYGGVIK